MRHTRSGILQEPRIINPPLLQGRAEQRTAGSCPMTLRKVTWASSARRFATTLAAPPGMCCSAIFRTTGMGPSRLKRDASPSR
ncbi:MAG: hypothetical protein H0U76_08750 [Ktedonobacteraceae bacterium]|nr:hypothetical protein [Ktedonobacteraceae bacterium]